MQSISKALNTFHDDGSWFARNHDLQLWLLRCDANLRSSVLELLPQFEFHHDNRSAWPLLLDAHTRTDAGWQLRTNNLAADWQRRVEAFAAENIAQGRAWAQQGLSGLAGFRATASLIMRVMAEPLVGLVVILAPTIVEDIEVLGSELTSLLGEPALARCRWVLVLDVDVPAPRALLAALGPTRCQETVCVAEDELQQRDLQMLLTVEDPARFGMTWPVDVTPPTRVDDRPPLAKPDRDAALRAAGINPATIEYAPQIRASVLGAALAMKAGHGQQAVALQQRACELCERLGLVEFHIITKLGLASYLSGLDQRALAKQVAGEAANLARIHELWRCESQAHLALGLLHQLERDDESAASAYVDAARAAEFGHEPQLAIEAWRMAGQLAAAVREDHTAIAAFTQALRVAGALDAADLPGSSAAEAARALAAVYERHLMHEQAASLHMLADGMEQTETNA